MEIGKSEARGQWGSRVGFIFAAAGSAVGLGNIWRFSYMTGENGGAAFVFVYLAFVFLIGFPLMINELTLGRASNRNPIDAFKTLSPKTYHFLTGALCLLLCFIVLSYYGVIAGWAIGYAVGEVAPSVIDTSQGFKEFAKNPAYVLPCFSVFMILTILIVQAGVEKGIERWVKVLMPLLLLIVVIIIGRSVTLEGAGAGVEYYLSPDFSKLTPEVIMAALGQAFFSLSVGWGLMITYGSYIPKAQNIVSGAFWVCLMDTTVALLGGFMIFPAVFAFGMDPAGGSGLAFSTLPAVFAQMTGGTFFAILFFLLLTVAALTSSISMLEVPVSYFLDNKKASRKAAAWIVGGLAFLVGIPSALSVGAVDSLTNMSFMGVSSFMDILDFVFGTLLVTIISLLCSIYVGWVWTTRKATEEIDGGAPGFSTGIGVVWSIFIKFVCPIVIVLAIVNLVFKPFG